MIYQILPRNDYNAIVKLNKNKIPCYSKKQFEKLRKENDFTVIGETKPKNKKQEISTLHVGDDDYIVSKLYDNSKTMYGVAGYVEVEDGKYIAVLQDKFPFWIFFIIVLALLVVTGVSIGQMLNNPSRPIVKPDNPLPTVDSNAEKIDGDDSQKAQSSNGGGSVSMSYMLDATLTLSDGNIDMYFQNPNASNHDVIVEMYILSGEKEYLIAKSGLVKAGYGITSMAFIKDSATLSPGVYNGKFNLLYYNPDTGEKAIVETEITDLKISVKN